MFFLKFNNKDKNKKNRIVVVFSASENMASADLNHCHKQAQLGLWEKILLILKYL